VRVNGLNADGKWFAYWSAQANSLGCGGVHTQGGFGGLEVVAFILFVLAYKAGLDPVGSCWAIGCMMGP